ncbi:S8 family serine peptidase [Streptomyces jumonjinensis]|uniref:S8 family peptidase n=2 Tax=Streptomyces jumonjinensis TaxID=1945 RepID=UPI003332857D
MTLITGDRVLVDAVGRFVRLEPAEGRDGISFRTRTVDGHTHVIPADAHRLVSEGVLDRRLFDVTELSRAASREAYRDGLKVIVAYRGGSAKAARAEVRAVGGTEVRLGAKAKADAADAADDAAADAVTTPTRDAGELWRALTRPSAGGSLSVTEGVSRIWLDGVVQATLDKSTAQIGAPRLWADGVDGTGVKIAVLDTGVDATHPDLQGQVLAQENFSSSPQTKDRHGHGTHVASIAAGTGAKSNGAHKGVAYGAKILSGKVLSDTGSGTESSIIGGIDWAVARGADIVNLSLSGTDTPELDPVEAHVAKVTEETGVLFVVGAGNNGPRAGSVGSPGSVDSALTIGAVDRDDELADFSSRGPLAGTGGLKPDVTAPGVGIVAAGAAGGTGGEDVGLPGYRSMTGTSMATPHAAGAAALLKQRHPGWRAKELKGALTGSAEAGPYTAFEQGAGRISVDRAIEQTVIADPVSVGFDAQRWPHTDDKPMTKQLTYRNLGAEAVTLALELTATDPEGRPAAAGFFTLGAETVTVPAGGTASVDLTADTRLGGAIEGHYSATVTATGGGQSVRTVAAVDREVESYELTVKHIGRDGRPNGDFRTDLMRRTGVGPRFVDLESEKSGVAKVRVPKGVFILHSSLDADPRGGGKGQDQLVQPQLTIDKNTTVTVDARKTKSVEFTIPDAKARIKSAWAGYSMTGRTPDDRVSNVSYPSSFKNFRTAHLGPRITDGSLSEAWAARWSKGSVDYLAVTGDGVERLSTGFTKRFQQSDLATVKLGLGGPAKDKRADLILTGQAAGNDIGGMLLHGEKTPGTRTFQLTSAGTGAGWEMRYAQYDAKSTDDFPVHEAQYDSGGPKGYKGGRTYEETFNTGVFGPAVGDGMGVYRKGDEIYGSLPVFADGQGHPGGSLYSSVKTTLHQGDTKVGENKDPLTGDESFTVGSGDAGYTLATSVERSAKVSKAASRIDAEWTFRSKRAAEGKLAKLPVSTARFGAKVGLDSTAPAGRTQSVPVTVQGPAAGKGLKSLSVHVSYDAGKSWKKLTVAKGGVSVKNPAKGKSLALRAKVTDKKGNTGSVTVYDAYFGK